MKERSFTIEHWQKVAICLMFFDAAVLLASYGLALAIRFDFHLQAIPTSMIDNARILLPIACLIQCAVFSYCHMYCIIWRFISVNELLNICIGNIVSFLLLGSLAMLMRMQMPFSFYLLGFFCTSILTVSIRYSYRIYLWRKARKEMTKEANKGTGKRTLLIGAGEAGQAIVRDIMKSSEIHDIPIGFIDDLTNKVGRIVESLPVFGTRNDIEHIVKEKQIDKIILTIPTIKSADKKEILEICQRTKCELQILPGIYQLVNGEVSYSSLKHVDVVDLLGRGPVNVDLNEICGYLENKVVLVTGGGGSIGSELCRQIAAKKPKRLIVVDIYENNAHAIGLELTDRFPDLETHILIASVRDTQRIESIFETWKPQIVFHAAAHKHVPLMEESPNESIKNNVLGTYKTAYAALCNDVERFVLISTDKAVNPTNIMGASKRMCEMVIQTFNSKVCAGRVEDLPEIRAHDVRAGRLFQNKRPKTEFVAVRFGNVLGSNGSVIPRFKEQIAKGGPVTVTDKRIVRFFMTIPEAVSLVLQAGANAQGGEIFVLDMGEPVKIDDLARNLITLSGFTPDEDIKIEYVGLRPGEKLYEERLMAEEGLSKTDNNLIYIGKPVSYDDDEFIASLQDLTQAVYSETDKVKDLVARIVTTYKPDKEHEGMPAYSSPVRPGLTVSGDHISQDSSPCYDASRKTQPYREKVSAAKLDSLSKSHDLS